MNKYEEAAAKKYIKDLILRKKSVTTVIDKKRIEKLIEQKMEELK